MKCTLQDAFDSCCCCCHYLAAKLGGGTECNNTITNYEVKYCIIDRTPLSLLSVLSRILCVYT